MLWFFVRNDQALRLETLYDNHAGEFVAVVTDEDGGQRTERFQTVDDLKARLDAFERLLHERGWICRRISA